MESYTYLLHWNQHCGSGETKGDNGWNIHLDDMVNVHNGARSKHFPRTRKARTVPTLPRKNALYPSYHYNDTPSEPCLPENAKGDKQSVQVHWGIKFRSVSNSCTLCFGLCGEIPLVLAWLLHTILERVITPIEKRIK